MGSVAIDYQSSAEDEPIFATKSLILMEDQVHSVSSEDLTMQVQVLINFTGNFLLCFSDKSVVKKKCGKAFVQLLLFFL